MKRKNSESKSNTGRKITVARSTDAGSYRSKQATGNVAPMCRQAVAADLPPSRVLLLHDRSPPVHDMLGSLVLPPSLQAAMQAATTHVSLMCCNYSDLVLRVLTPPIECSNQAACRICADVRHRVPLEASLSQPGPEHSHLDPALAVDHGSGKLSRHDLTPTA